MRQSRLFGKTLREGPKDEVSKNAELLTRGGFVSKEMAGIYSFLPMGLRVLKKIETVIRREMNETLGAQELLMPALHPIENYIKTGRHKIEDLFHTQLHSGGKLVLGQSHEEIVVPLVQRFISSWRDLPLGVYQIQTKFRNEFRAKSGLLRGREFIMKDLYSFHADEKDFAEYYERAKIAYKNIFAGVGMGDKTFLTFASGGTFSKYSHEFQTLTDAGEDTIYLCKNCRVAINDDIISEQSSCWQCGAARDSLDTKKSIEVGNIFPLKTRYSDAFGLAYTDESGTKKPIIMGCYGIGLGRVMGAVVETSCDEKGIVWPEAIAPYRVHLIEIKSARSEVKREAESVYGDLLAKGIEVLYDERDDKSPGEKFADADLIGIPWRIVVSEKTIAKKGVELKSRRETGEKIVPTARVREEIQMTKSK